jgi:hypothetical protein
VIEAFCVEIGAPELVPNATFAGVLAALDGELLLPLRAFSEGLAYGSLYTTFGGDTIPHEPIDGVVHELMSATLAGRFSEWRYTNAVGKRQLEGLSAAQIAKWMEASSSTHGDLRVHEDEPGELGLWWATKIGGPSHGFDYEAQCLLPLLCNARHKVVLVSDPAYPHNPAGRAHFRLLWVHGTSPPRAVLWLEGVHTDFSARVSSRKWLPAVLAHAAMKAYAMGVGLSVEAHLEHELRAAVEQHLGGIASEVAQCHDRLVLRPSKGVLEASDYLSGCGAQKVSNRTERCASLYSPP